MLIKKLFILLILLSFTSFYANSAEIPQVSARSAVVIDSDTNSVIYEKNMSERLSMASTTKIMTAVLAIESGKMSCTVKAERDIVCDGTSIGIKKGDCYTLETLVWAMLLESGNDAAILTAEYLTGSEDSFSVLMNSKAQEIGMKQTNFVTSSGLDDQEHYTTAYDMALLASYAIKNPVFRQICSSEKHYAQYISPNISEMYSNHNKLLRMYDGVFGVKTGFTKKSGRCLVSACEKDGITLVAVTLNAPDDWNDHIAMYDYCFSASSLEKVKMTVPSDIRLYGSDRCTVRLDIPEVFINKNCDNQLSYQVFLPEFVYAPVKKGDTLGRIVLYIDGKRIKVYDIIAAETLMAIEAKEYPELTFIQKLKNILNLY